MSIDEHSLVLLHETRPRRLVVDGNVSDAPSLLPRESPHDSIREFIEAADDAFVSWDALGAITEWTPQAEALFGWSRDEAIGHSFATLVVAPRHRIVHALRTERFLHEGELPLLGQWFEIAGLRRDMHEITIEMTVWADSHQTSRAFNAFIRAATKRTDIDEANDNRTRLQTVLAGVTMVDAVRKRATYDLVHMIMDLRAAVGRERAMVGQMRELNRNTNDLVAVVSHELRTPLTNISAYAELLADPDVGPLSNCQRYLLEVVDRNVNALLTMVENLVTISGIEAGAFEVEMRPLELLPIVRAAAEAMLPSAREQCIKFTLDLAHDTGLALGDAPQLDRLLLNLLSNAVKFNFDGGNVTVSSRRLDSDIEIEIADTGMGIPIEEQDKLFAPFFRSTMAQARAVPGSGLGLVVAKNIVDRHGGAIKIRSAPGDGTTVRLTLPAAQPTAAQTSVSASATTEN